MQGGVGLNTVSTRAALMESLQVVSLWNSVAALEAWIKGGGRLYLVMITSYTLSLARKNLHPAKALKRRSISRLV